MVGVNLPGIALGQHRSRQNYSHSEPAYEFHEKPVSLSQSLTGEPAHFKFTMRVRSAQKCLPQPSVHGNYVACGFGALVAAQPNYRCGAILRKNRALGESPLRIEVSQLVAQLFGG